MRNLFIAFFLLCSTIAVAQAGTLDPTFGRGGIVKTIIGNKEVGYGGTPLKMFVLANGKLLVVTEIRGSLVLARFSANGVLDSTFANNGYSKGIVFSGPYDAAMQPDGKIVLTGTEYNVYPARKGVFKIACLNSDGSLDSTFGNSGIVLTHFDYDVNTPYAITVQPDTKIIVVGTAAQDVMAGGVFALARYNTNGSLDSTFGDGGRLTTDLSFHAQGMAVTLDSAGNLLVAGTVYKSDSDGDFALARYNAYGVLDETFGQGGKLIIERSQTNDRVNDVTVDRMNNIILAGMSDAGNGRLLFTLLRYRKDGTPDSSFNGAGIVTLDFGGGLYNPHELLIQKDNKIIVNGSTAIADFTISRFNTDGSVDGSFNGTGENTIQFEGYMYSMASVLALQDDGRIVAAGFAANYNTANYSELALARYNTDGRLDGSFGNGGKATSVLRVNLTHTNQLFTVPDDKILVSGTGFAEWDSRPFMTRYNGDGSTDTTFGQKGILLIKEPTNVLHAVQTDGEILTGGMYNDPSGYAIVRFHQNGTPDIAYGNSGVNMVLPSPPGPSAMSMGPMFVQKDNKLISGYSLSIFEPTYNLSATIARYNTDGTLDVSFGTKGKITGSSFVSVCYKQHDDKFWVSQEVSATKPDSIIVTRYTANGFIDSTFGQNGKVTLNFFIGSIAEQQNGDFIILGGKGNWSKPSFALYRLRNNGLLDSTFVIGSHVPLYVRWLISQEDDKIIAGGIRQGFSGNAQIEIVRYTSNGMLDSTFGQNGTALTELEPNSQVYVNQVSVYKNRLYVLGSSENVNAYGFIEAYLLTSDTTTVKCPPDTIVSTDPGLCSATVYGIDPVVSKTGARINYKLTGATTGEGVGTASGKSFNKGITYITYSLLQDTSKSCTFSVTVKDTTAPSITHFTANTSVLRLPDGKMKEVLLDYTISDNCSLADTKVSVTSNEPERSSDPNDLAPDWEVIDAHHIRLRAERLLSGTGRIYTITLTGTDASGNTAEQAVTVAVPKTTSNDSLQNQLQVIAAPNPSYNHFTVMVESTSNEPITIQVLNNVGKIIETQKANPYQTTSFGSSYGPGLYFIEVVQGRKKTTTKVIKMAQ